MHSCLERCNPSHCSHSTRSSIFEIFKTLYCSTLVLSSESPISNPRSSNLVSSTLNSSIVSSCCSCSLVLRSLSQSLSLLVSLCHSVTVFSVSRFCPPAHPCRFDVLPCKIVLSSQTLLPLQWNVCGFFLTVLANVLASASHRARVKVFTGTS